MSIPTTSHTCYLSPVTEVLVDDPENEYNNLPLICDRYKDRLTNLTKEKGWLTESMYLYQGHWFSSRNTISIETVMDAQDTFQANPSDIYLATPPKSGTTWLKALAFAIVNRSRYSNNHPSTHPLHISNPHDCVPYIENEVLRSKPTYTDASRPRLFATHMPYTSLPHPVFDSCCRLVYMCRNPKDVLVSMFHFVNKLRDKSLGLITLEEAFEKFRKGVTPCGPYWDHVIGYYKASLEHPTRVLFLTYENMKIDTANYVIRLAKFLGYPFSKEEEAKGAVQDIISLCSFKNLSEVNKNGNIRAGLPRDAFFRKGQTGDSAIYLTNEMIEILDQITKEKFHNLDIMF